MFDTGNLVTLLGAVVLITITIAAPAAAFYAAVTVNRLKSKLGYLQSRIAILEEIERSTVTKTTPSAAPETERENESGSIGEAEPTEDPPEEHKPPPCGIDIQAEPSAAIGSQQNEAPARAGFETILATRWMVWFGGATVALAGIFLVKYGIDHTILSPAARIGLGVLMGIALIAGGEWIRRKPLPPTIERMSTSYVPTALTGAGVVTAYGSIYAGYVLYGLMGPPLVFVSLSLLCATALGLSLLQGPFIAVLGLIGAYTVPALVEADAPSAWMLFGYLFMVAAATAAILRYRNWWWLGWTALVGATAWQAIWIAAYWQPGDLAPLATHLLALSGLAIGARIEDIARPEKPVRNPLLIATLGRWEMLVVATASLTAVMTFVLIQVEGYGNASLAFGLFVTAVLISAAVRFRQLEVTAIAAAALSLALLVGWHTATSSITLGKALTSHDILTVVPPLPPSEWPHFMKTAALIGGGLGLTGFFKLRRTCQPVYWAGLSAAMPIVVMLVAYWRLGDAGTPWSWGATALLMAACFIGAAAEMARRRPDDREMEKALGVYAVAAVAAVAVGWSLMLDHGSLTVALAVLLPAMAWGQLRFAIAWLRPAAAILAVIVGVRLALLHHLSALVLDTPLEPAWILATFGIPTAAFGLTALMFRRVADDVFVVRLESAAIAVGTASVSLLIRYYLGDGTLSGGRYTLLEQSLHTITWLMIGYALYRRHRTHPRPSTIWTANVLFTLAAIQTGILQLLVSNPLFTDNPVASWPVFNVLALAYLAPAGLATLIRQEAVRQGHGIIRRCAGIAALALVFVYLTVEVRHLFHGPVLSVGPMTDAEGYAYSLAWMVYAASLLIFGIWKHAVALRYAGLGFILAVVAKVFLWDMSSLTGLYRVASFLGLGLSLIGIGFLYQRYVLRPSDGRERKGS